MRSGGRRIGFASAARCGHGEPGRPCPVVVVVVVVDSIPPPLPAAWASLLLGSFLLFPSPYFPFLFEGLAFFRAIDSTRLYTCTAAAAWKGKKPLADFLFGDFCLNCMVSGFVCITAPTLNTYDER